MRALIPPASAISKQLLELFANEAIVPDAYNLDPELPVLISSTRGGIAPSSAIRLFISKLLLDKF